MRFLAPRAAYASTGHRGLLVDRGQVLAESFQA